MFADRGFKGPYRKWLELDRDVFYKTMDKFDIPLTEINFHLADETLAYLVDFLNKSEHFNGFCSFSQGAVATRYFYLFAQYFKKKIDLKVPVPTFVILFSVPQFPYMNSSLEGKFLAYPTFHLADG